MRFINTMLSVAVFVFGTTIAAPLPSCKVEPEKFKVLLLD